MIDMIMPMITPKQHHYAYPPPGGSDSIDMIAYLPNLVSSCGTSQSHQPKWISDSRPRAKFNVIDMITEIYASPAKHINPPRADLRMIDMINSKQ